MKRFWTSWYSRDDEESGCTRPPFQYFVSGEDMGGTRSLCTVFDAESEADIWRLVESHFPDFKQRFVKEVVGDFLPDDGRFPGATAYAVGAGGNDMTIETPPHVPAWYQASQDLILDAESAASADDLALAVANWLAAARLQHGAFANYLSRGKIRSACVFGLSAATLYYRAGAYAESETVCVQVLAIENGEGHSLEKAAELFHRVTAARLKPLQNIAESVELANDVLRRSNEAQGFVTKDGYGKI
jgi:hypothetical protein